MIACATHTMIRVLTPANITLDVAEEISREDLLALRDQIAARIARRRAAANESCVEPDPPASSEMTAAVRVAVDPGKVEN